MCFPFVKKIVVYSLPQSLQRKKESSRRAAEIAKKTQKRK